MITILAGKIDDGKTSKLKEIYQTTKSGDGFACEKVFIFGKLEGYQFVRLSTGEKIPFMIKQIYYKGEDIYNREFKAFRYSQKAFDDVLKVIKQLIKDGVEPIYLDEIGAMELLKKGHDEAFRLINKSHVDAVICVRDTLVRNVINHYRLKDYKVLGVKTNE